MPKILLYLLFLVAYVGWALACAKSLKQLQSSLVAGKSFWSSEMILLEGLVGFFGFIYMLSGLWSLKLVLLILVASHMGGLVAWLLSAILGSMSEKTGMRAMWAGKEIDIRYPVPMLILGIMIGLLSFSYPVVAGILFFHHPWGSPVLQILMVKYTLLLQTLSGYVLLVIVNVLLLSSENLDDETRQRIFINQMIGLIPAAIYLALAFWAFGIGGGALDIGILGIPTGTISLQTLILLLILFAATVLIPFLVGTQRARIKSQRLLERFKNFVAELEGILEVPTGPLYIPKINQLRQNIAGTQQQMVNGDALLVYDAQLQQNPNQIPDSEKTIADAIQKTRDLDPRFNFLDDLDKFSKELDDVVADLQTRTPATIEDTAKRWSERFKIRKEELVKTIDAAASKKPLITASAGSVLSAIVMAILSEVGKTAWEWIKQAPR